MTVGLRRKRNLKLGGRAKLQRSTTSVALDDMVEICVPTDFEWETHA